MAEFIKREKVCEILSVMSNDIEDIPEGGLPKDYIEGWKGAMAEAIDKVKSILAADVRSERHGYWIPIFENAADEKRGVAIKYQCSECGGIAKDGTYSHAMDYEFCSRCGVKMDGGAE